ncbi:MAG: ATP-dependent metallopeptidase FtsH/Yme1/Tma family protein, partial [Ornithinimicrobium sp.]
MSTKKKQRRSPWLWVALIVGFGVLTYALMSPSAYARIDTSDTMQLIAEGKVASATVTPDRIDLDLK